MLLSFDYQSSEDYTNFIKLKSLPSYSWKGRMAVVPDAYAHMFTSDKPDAKHHEPRLGKHLFDYQRDIAATAIRKKKYAIFAECGLGKTLIMLEFAKHAAKHAGKAWRKTLEQNVIGAARCRLTDDNERRQFASGPGSAATP